MSWPDVSPAPVTEHPLTSWPSIVDHAGPKCEVCRVPVRTIDVRCPTCLDGGHPATAAANVLLDLTGDPGAPPELVADALARFLFLAGWEETDRVVVELPTGTRRVGTVTRRPIAGAALHGFGLFVRLDTMADPGPGPHFVPLKWLRPIPDDVLTAAGEVVDGGRA